MRGPTPGVRAPVHVSGFFCLESSCDGAGAVLIPVHCLDLMSCVWCCEKIQTDLLCLYSTHLLFILSVSPLQDAGIWSKSVFYYKLHGASVLKLDRTWSLFTLIWFSPFFFQPGLGAKRRPRNFPEELDRNYVVRWFNAEGQCVTKGCGWGAILATWPLFFSLTLWTVK